MDRCDVIVIGGGPAGSTCATRLAATGLDVVVIDRAVFPRDKVCAGWITPAVVRAIHLDLADYGRRHTLQPFTRFRTGALDRPSLVTTRFDEVISYGIRRCEFDTYLLERSGARRLLGQPVRDIRRDEADWVVDDRIRAPMLVGAGGHFCPVARRLNVVEGSPGEGAPVVVAQEIERSLEPGEASRCRVSPSSPELYFWPDLMGYGWCVRKGAYLNVGVGRLTQSRFPAAVEEFKQMLRSRDAVPPRFLDAWKGHAYLLNVTSRRRVHDEGVLLVGDAAGLALAPSGEGILAAVESGVMAAGTIVTAAGRYSTDDLAGYAGALDQRFGRRGGTQAIGWLPDWLMTLAGRTLLQSPWLTRRWLLERAFLHQDRQPLSALSESRL